MPVPPGEEGGVREGDNGGLPLLHGFVLRATAEALEGEGPPRVHLQLGDVQQGSPPLDKEQAQAAKVDGGGGGGGRGGGGAGEGDVCCGGGDWKGAGNVERNE